MKPKQLLSCYEMAFLNKLDKAYNWQVGRQKHYNMRLDETNEELSSIQRRLRKAHVGARYESKDEE